MSTPLEIITVRAADFATDANIDFYITQATGRVSACFGDLQNDAIALMTMHLMALDSRPGSGNAVGNVKSEKEGDLSRSFGINDSGDGDPYLSQTTWGLEYQRLMDTKFLLPRNRFIDEC